MASFTLASLLSFSGGEADVLDVVGNYAYVAGISYGSPTSFGSSTLSIIDISNPAQPTLVGSSSVSDLFASVGNNIPSPYDVVVSGGYAYEPMGTFGLLVFNVSNPLAPSFVDEFCPTGSNFTSMVVQGHFGYVTDFTSSTVKVIDLSDPANLTVVGTYAAQNPTLPGQSAAPGRLAVLGNYLYVGDESGNIEIVDVSNPAQPKEVADYPGNFDKVNPGLPTAPYGMIADGHYLYVADAASGFFILDVSNPAAPSLVGAYAPVIGTSTFEGFTSLQIVGQYAYLEGNRELLQLDIRDPTKPILIGTFATTGAPSGDAIGTDLLYVSGNHAYVADGPSGFEIINITNVSQPPVLSSVAPTANFFELGSAVRMSPNLQITDANSNTLIGATVSISDGKFIDDGDVLSAITTGTDITASYDSTTETLTLTGIDTLSDYQRVLDSVAFETPSHDPTDAWQDPSRTITWSVNDGTSTSAPVASKLAIDVLGLDTSTNITTANQVTAIADAGYHFVVQYLGDPPTRIQNVDTANLAIVSVYENSSMTSTPTKNNHKGTDWKQYFSTSIDGSPTANLPGLSVAANNGYLAAAAAYQDAQKISQPFGSAIYFAIDLDEPSALAGISEFFEGVDAFFDTLPQNESYTIGVYGASTTLTQLQGTIDPATGQPVAQYYWLTTSFEGDNIPYRTSGLWDLWQPNVNVPGFASGVDHAETIDHIGIDTDYASVKNFGSWTPVSTPSINASSTFGSGLAGFESSVENNASAVLSQLAAAAGVLHHG